MNNDVLKESLKKLQALHAVSELEGVQILVQHTKSAVATIVLTLAGSYFEKSEQELRALCATLKANLELYQLITGCEDEIKSIESALQP